MREPDKQDFYYETRFAVVMYGGISLAIYINGVAQELHRMVRATARKEDGGYLVEKPDESEKVYRKIGEKLGTKFVVDILSGTSAGGLNAIFLAKALANNQDFSTIADVWKNVADVNTLIYDQESIKGLPVRLEVPNLPPYLMNSQRMAYLLYKAFNEMGNDMAENETSNFVNELDLYVTATDLYGRNVKLYTTNQNIFPEEKRYRKMFHLRYAKGVNKQNDLTNDDNPFLAFISRCTSAIPPAFEPMTLNDMLNMPGVEVKPVRKKYWEKYFEETENDGHLARPYGDGGYLDNKPFSYATEGLLNRTADHPVDRKLIYVDPSPQDLSHEKTSGGKPNVFENVTKAAVTLPMYEPIRDDIEAVHRRNRVIERTQEALREVEKHLYKISPENIKTISSSDWPKLGLKECIERMDPPFGAYITLRINALMDGITSDIAASRNLDLQSAGYFELHQAVWAAFNNSYTSEPEKVGEEKKATWNQFLQDADLDWRIRRLNFLHAKIDEMLVLANTLQSSLDHLGFAEKRLLLNKEGKQKEQAGQEKPSKQEIQNEVERQAGEFFKQSIQKRINDLFYEINLEKPDPNTIEYKNNLYNWISATFNVSMDAQSNKPRLDETKINDLLKIDEFPSLFVKALEQIKSGLNGIQNKLNDARITVRVQAKDTGTVDEYIKLFYHKSDQASEKSRRKIKDELGLFWDKFSSGTGNQPDGSAGEGFARQVAMLYLQAPYESYEYYDRLTYPLVIANDLGEADIVDIWRISPNDSMVFDPRKEPKYKQKLGGQTLVNFGAFFKKEWRENDIMWGRLDGAEQIIRSLGLPKDEEDACIQDAQSAILKNEVSHNNVRLKGILDQDQQYRNFSMDAPGFDNAIMTAFKDNFNIDLSLEARSTLQIAARSAQVTGKIFEGLSSQYSSFAKWITKTGQFIFWVAEMATTDSWLHIIARNIYMLLYFAGFFLVTVGSLSTVGALFSVSRLTTVGWGIIGFTAFLQYANYIFSQILNMKVQLNPQAEQNDAQKKKIQFFPLFIIPIAMGALLLLTSINSEKLINILTMTKEFLGLFGIILLILGLVFYLVNASWSQIKAMFSNPKNDAWAYLVLIVVFAASIALMDWSFAPLKGKGYSILNLEFANAAQKATILHAWAGKEIYIWQHLFFDFGFLISLSAFLWLVWNRFAKRIAELQGQNNLEGFCGVMSALAVIGGILDGVENIAIMGMLSGYSIEKLGPMTLIFTYMKFIMYALPALLWPFFGIWLWGASAQKKQAQPVRPA